MDYDKFRILLLVLFIPTINCNNQNNDECSTNYLNVTCTFISQYGSLFKRTPNNCYSELSFITDFSVISCNDEFLYDLFHNNDKNHVIGYKNDKHHEFMRGLKQIQWNYNRLQSLKPSNFSNLINLKSIDLSHNKLTTLVTGLFDTVSTKLRVLDLSHNVISNIEPNTFDTLNTLEILNLSYNKLESLPAFNQPTLREIHLNDNKLVAIDGDFHSHFPFLTKIYLMNNQLMELTLIDNGPIEIDLRHNRLHQLVIAVNGTGTHLKKLNLQNNKLTEIDIKDGPEDRLICGLNYLDLTSNNITNISFLENLRELRSIKLAQNDLTKLKNDDFRRLFIAIQNIETIDLGTCRLEHSEEQFILDGNFSGSSEIYELNDELIDTAESETIGNFKCEGLKKLLDEAKNLKYLRLVLEDLSPDHRSLSKKVQNVRNGNCRDDEIQRIIRMQKDLQEKHASIFEYLKNIMATIKKTE